MQGRLLRQIQPLVILNLPRGLYLRSTATIGKVWKLHNGTTSNCSPSPKTRSGTTGSHCNGRSFSGLNFQFPIVRAKNN